MTRRLLALLGLAGALIHAVAASAAPYSFDVSGTGSATFDTILPSSPPAPCTNAGTTLLLACPSSAGSTLDLDITSGIATITRGTLEIYTYTESVGGLPITITTKQTLSLSGGLGALSGNDIVWTEPADYTLAGTFRCDGPCAYIYIDSGVDYPIQLLLYGIDGALQPSQLQLGTWSLDPSLTSILGSSRAVFSISDGSRPVIGAPAGTPMAWLLFGAQDLGAVPEPGGAVLVLLGAASALALRGTRSVFRQRGA